MKGKLIKIISATGLAMIMGAGVLCGVLVAPAGASPANANTQAGLSAGQNASGADSAPKIVENADGSIQIGLTEEETTAALMNGTWECEPETDPVIYTTDYGLDVKLHLSGYKSDPSTIGKLLSGKFSGYAYISAGGYNWAIIGRSSSITNKSLTGHLNIANLINTFSSFTGYSSNTFWSMLANKDSTPAGSQIYNEYKNGKDVVYSNAAVTAIYANPSTFLPNAKAITDTSELAQDEVLCFAQTYVTSSKFYASKPSSNVTAYTTSSTLYSTCKTWYTNNLQSSLGSYVIQKTLITQYKNGQTTVAANLFPLAAYDKNSIENYYWSTYLSSGKDGNMDIGEVYWTRSGNASNDAYPRLMSNGSISSGYEVTSTAKVRPAFVLKI